MDNLELNKATNANSVLPFPISLDEVLAKRRTPNTDAMEEEAGELDLLSKYPCTFDYSTYRNLELRYSDRPIFGGTVMKKVFRLGNFHSTCQQCLYSFEIDTYGRGCIHDCAYCYAKAELTVHGMWNNPIPVPANLNEIRKQFYLAFETEKKGKWADLLRRRIPLRIGSMSDSFMWMDQKYKITQELLKILKFYRYPYVIFTRSDLVATEEYMNLLDNKLCAVQFSLSSVNEAMIRKMEPGAPSAKRRLAALQKLGEAGYWTTVRINPMFPIYPDGYFTDETFDRSSAPRFEYTSFEMVDAIADHKVPAILGGFGRFSRLSMNAIEKTTGTNLRSFYKPEGTEKSPRDYHFSDKEIRHYYYEFHKRARARNMQFTTCYIGNGDSHFWKHQDLWSNKKDCCNVKNRVATFERDAREIRFEDRLKFTSHKDTKPVDPQRLHSKLGINLVRAPEVSASIDAPV